MHELFTIKEFTENFAVSRTSLYREVSAGRLSLLKRGRRSFVARVDAEKWVANLPRFEGSK